MKRIQVSRKIFTNISTIGDIFFDGEFVCSSLEDTIRNVKVVKKTAIPSGDYKIELRHSNKFDRIMPFLLNVPYFDGVMFHWGNDAEASAGCILTGHYDDKQPDWVSSSRKSFQALFSMIDGAVKSGEETIVSIYGGLKKEEFIEAKKMSSEDI